jgi:hypothetical protein
MDHHPLQQQSLALDKFHCLSPQNLWTQKGQLYLDQWQRESQKPRNNQSSHHFPIWQGPLGWLLLPFFSAQLQSLAAFQVPEPILTDSFRSHLSIKTSHILVNHKILYSIYLLKTEKMKNPNHLNGHYLSTFDGECFQIYIVNY